MISYTFLFIMNLLTKIFTIFHISFIILLIFVVLYFFLFFILLSLLFPRTVIYDSNDEDVSTAPIYNYLIDGNYGLDILIYSGDDDSVCATIGSQEWVNLLFLKFD